jgi:hypothetical protein
VNWLEEKTIKIPDFLIQKTRKLTKLNRTNNRQAMPPVEISRLENQVNKEVISEAKNSNRENMGLILQLQTIFVNLFVNYNEKLTF